MQTAIDWEHADRPIPHFGDPGREYAAAMEGTVLCPLGHFGQVRFHGRDVTGFLQAQLTCDLTGVTETAARFGGYCSPQGRLLADFLLFATGAGHFMHLPAPMAISTAERLRRFVLRSQVGIEAESGLRAIGIAGPGALRVLERSFGDAPRAPLDVANRSGVTLLGMPGGMYLIFAPAHGIAELWRTLAAEALPAGGEVWNWLQIRHGIPWISPLTQDQFVPQMVGLDAIGGISFEKGCYPGQEIVARARYLGEVKRHLHRGHTSGEAQAGEALVTAGRSAGMIVQSARAPGGGSDFLAVVQDASAEEALHLRDAEGPTASLSGPLHRVIAV